jgi:hypothetical protein
VETPPAAGAAGEMTLALSWRKVLPGQEWATNNAATPMNISEAANKTGRSHL